MKKRINTIRLQIQFGVGLEFPVFTYFLKNFNYFFPYVSSF